MSASPHTSRHPYDLDLYVNLELPCNQKDVTLNTVPLGPSRAGRVLAVVAETLTRQPHSDAREHFQSLRARTRRLQRDFVDAIETADALIAEWRQALQDDAAVSDAFKRRDSDQEPFRRIAPIVAANFQRVAQMLATATEPAPPATTLEVLNSVEFEDFIDLGAAVRQYTDSLVETSYQLAALDAAKFNFKFLDSLYSFAPVAPESLRQTLYSGALQATLTEFAEMKGGQRNNSEFSRNEHAQFGQRVAWLLQQLGANDELEWSLTKIFKFSSDFVHLGYASGVALAPSPQIVMGTGDFYTPRTLNYAELRVRLLGECVRYYAEVFLPALAITFEAMLIDPANLTERARDMGRRLQGVRQYLAGHPVHEFIKDGLIGSDQTIHIECGLCGTNVDWQPPHSMWDCYCEGCGKRFVADVVAEAVDYIVSGEGVSKVNGSDAPEIADLSESLREKLQTIRLRHLPEREGAEFRYLRITDLEHVDIETLEVPSIVTSRPGPQHDGQFQLVAYVASKALERQPQIEVHCNCRTIVTYQTATGTNVCRCLACNNSIGIFGLAGDASHLPVMDAPGGSPRLVPIHGARSTQLKQK